MIPRFCLIKIGCNWTREIIKWNAHLMIHRFRSIKIGCNWTREIIKWKLHSRNHSSPCTNLHICIQKTGPAAPAAHRAKKTSTVTNTTQTPNCTPHFPVGCCPSLVFCSLVFELSYAARAKGSAVLSDSLCWFDMECTTREQKCDSTSPRREHRHKHNTAQNGRRTGS